MLRTASVTESEPTHVMLSKPAACVAWMKRLASAAWQKSTTTSAPLRRSTSTFDEKSAWPLTKLVDASTWRRRLFASNKNSCMPDPPDGEPADAAAAGAASPSHATLYEHMQSLPSESVLCECDGSSPVRQVVDLTTQE